MDTTTTSSTGNHASKSELEKFRLFYEFDVPEKEIRSQIKKSPIIRKSPQS